MENINNVDITITEPTTKRNIVKDFFFYVIQKVEINDLWFFIEKLYCAADHNFDLFMFKNVKDIILFNTCCVNKTRVIDFWGKH